MSDLHMCMCMLYAGFMLPEILRGHWIPLELEWIVTCELYVGAGNQTWVLCMNNRCSLPLRPANMI